MSQGSAIRLTSQELARFFGKIQINKTTQCWEWTASKTPQGYAQINYQRRPMVAHRVSYRAFVGEIHRGLVIDHLCRVRHCVNPAHLEEEMRIRHREYARQYRLRQKAKMAAVTADLPFLPATTAPPHTD